MAFTAKDVVALRERTVFDSSGRTISDASHAVGAVLSPNRSLIHQLNIVKRAMRFASFAANAGVIHMECLCGEHIFTPEGV